jgi:hypothetical protein
MKRFMACLLCAIFFNAACGQYTTNNIDNYYGNTDEIDLEANVDLNIPWFTKDEQTRIKEDLTIDIPAEKPPLELDKNERKEVVLDVKNSLSDRVETAKKVDKSLQNMVRLAAFTLRKKGYYEEAKRIEQEYGQYYSHYTFNHAIGLVQDIGDHPPMWEWLDKLEKDLRALLGDFVMQVTRLEDLKVFNYSIPIVLHPDGDIRTEPPTLITKLDYKQHFVPFAGALGYWTAWGVCTGATWGLGAVVFICSPIGMVAERVVETKIAPDLSDKIWERYND